MEKRKLAKIPREEATDEMVRFSERAAGTHIVTTKDIEKDLLMVTFYPIRNLKKGEKSAQLRTFFSKNDYISQDLTTEKVKWLTAAYDRMVTLTARAVRGGKATSFGHMCHSCFAKWLTSHNIPVPDLENKKEIEDGKEKL
ncbi:MULTISPECIES: hypothetical protein [unclassified Ruminococcus]|uniref:hypothetical protein n=1 Tax=unclassified Ruminococcus TaxID=2608920 RepID=UPI0018AB7C69|nr:MULTISPECIES: hypothetical protein [unclassified Ruminococcus]MDB8774704.1 hypothetical protein [Ruminococcus sp. 1001136sp1]